MQGIIGMNDILSLIALSRGGEAIYRTAGHSKLPSVVVACALRCIRLEQSQAWPEPQAAKWLNPASPTGTNRSTFLHLTATFLHLIHCNAPLSKSHFFISQNKQIQFWKVTFSHWKTHFLLQLILTVFYQKSSPLSCINRHCPVLKAMPLVAKMQLTNTLK